MCCLLPCTHLISNKSSNMKSFIQIGVEVAPTMTVQLNWSNLNIRRIFHACTFYTCLSLPFLVFTLENTSRMHDDNDDRPMMCVDDYASFSLFFFLDKKDTNTHE